MLWGAFLWLLSWCKQGKQPARPQDEWKLLLLKDKIKNEDAGFWLDQPVGS